MAQEQPWDQKLMDYLKAAGEELRRTGEELKAESQRVLDEVTDPEIRTRLKERLQQLGQAAKKTAAEASSKLQEAFYGKAPKAARKPRGAAKKGKKRPAKKTLRRRG
ncbi:MAG: hypothetical protein ACLQDQ_15185 [Myxococcaceae bacterium]